MSVKITPRLSVQADLVVLAVKPQAMPAVLSDAGPALSREISWSPSQPG